MICATCQERIAPASPSCPRCGTPAPSTRTGGDREGDTRIPAGSELTGLPGIPGDADRTVFPGNGGALLDEAALSSSIRPDLDQTILPGAIGHDTDRTMLSGTSHGAALATLSGSEDDPDRTMVPGGGEATGDTGPLKVGQTFGPRYHIIKLVGLGGMGAVYQAWDAELGVAVALKVIRPEVAADPEAARDLERRFKRELLLARQVTHKNVVRIHDLGEIDGIKYITMPFVDGSDLASVLATEGALPAPRVIRIARTALSGLVAAHQAGVVHRDLKPANIMIGADDEALIMDFGIARSTGGGKEALRRPPGAGMGSGSMQAGATVTGEVVGTVQYMAPEQARGETADQRADVYSFGLILYDMLLGPRRHATAASAIAELRGRIEQPPPPPRMVDESVPEALDRIIVRCLAPKAEERYADAGALAADLALLDDEGRPLPSSRRTIHLTIVGALILVVSMFGVNWWLVGNRKPPAQHDPVSVLIADFDNRANDTSLTGTLEPVLKMALEGAGFISAYDRSGIRANLGVRPPEKLDERAALELAVRQGVAVVLSGSVERRGAGYGVAVKATQAVTGNVIANASGRASSKDQVLSVATGLAARVREALGDDTTGSQLFGMDSLSATSLDIVREYAVAMEALSNSKFQEALRAYSQIVERDPKFGLGYLGMAVSLRNLNRHQEAQKYMQEALRHLDSMTERERLRTRGLAFKWAGDYQACVKEFGDLLARYESDAMAHNNLAGCQSYLRDLPKAIEGMRQAVKILPKRNLYRENLALYAAYGSDFLTAEREARAIENPGLFGVLPLAFAQALQGQVAEATETYRRLSAVDDEQGPSYTASGLGDLAIYQGRFAEAERILEKGALADLAGKNPDQAAAKYAALGHARVQHGAKGPAIAAGIKALANSQAVKIRFLAARVFVEAGDVSRATPLIASLAAELQAEPQAYAKILEGEVALKSGKPRDAIKVVSEANTLFDTWLGHLVLGRAYLEAGAFMQADSEFDRCLKRRGEAVSLFLDEEPTYGLFPPAYYYQGRAREGLNSGFAESYRAYLAIRGESKEDPLAADARRRAGQPASK